MTAFILAAFAAGLFWLCARQFHRWDHAYGEEALRRVIVGVFCGLMGTVCGIGAVAAAFVGA